MPTYAYACTECDHRFEAVQSFSDDSLTVCPECEGRLRKVFNAVGIVFKGGYEVLGGDDGVGNRAFQTPLATKHAFQGWADVFLTTPADGIEDAYVGATVPLWGGQLQAWYHDFDAEQGSTSYGDEIDLSYGHPIPAVPGLTALVKYASYDADTAVLRGNVANVDTDKLWLQMQYIY